MVLEGFGTVSIIVAAASGLFLGLGLRRVAAVGFLSLGAGAAALVWNDWSTRAGEPLRIYAFLNPVALTEREVFLLATHAPLFILGCLLVRRGPPAPSGG